MCGIVGYIRRRSNDLDDRRKTRDNHATHAAAAAAADDDELSRMLRHIAHRGPDGEGTWHTNTPDEWHVALGHRRLSIVDLEGGAQPMSDGSGRCHITFNGEIYNHDALRIPLLAAGVALGSRSDTQTLVNHFAASGSSGLADVAGMFAFACWDNAAQSLTLARDRAGIKPLYYAPLPCGGIAFASELLALVACGGVSRDLDPHGLASFFYRDYVHPPGSILAGVRKLQPGHTLTWSHGQLETPRAFWSLASVAARQTKGPARSDAANGDLALIAELRSHLDAAVASQMMSDVPIGVFLSGGVDSSLVAALAARHTASLTTFSIGFDDADYDESPFASQVARHLGSRHVCRRFSETDLVRTLDAALDTLDEPMADPSILPTFMLCTFAAAHVKVALGGDGGDELWAGYPTYRAHQLAAIYGRVPAAIHRAIVKPAVARLPVRHGYQTLDWKLKRFITRWSTDPQARHEEWMSSAAAPDLRLALSTAALRPPALAGIVLPPAARGDVINQMLALDVQSYLPGSVLAKVDRASMACGLEVRPPLLDDVLIQFAFSLPSTCKIRRKSSKWLLKQAAAGLLPPGIIDRRKKGFGIPLARWIGTALDTRVRALLHDSPVWSTGLLRRDTFLTWHQQHLARHTDYSRPIWALIVLDHWYRRLLELR